MKFVGPTKIPICEKCGRRLKGKVSADATQIVCFFCNNPRGEQDDDANLILKSKDTK